MEKIKAVMLGHAIGDALGVPVEFCNRKMLDKKPVTDMLGYGTYSVPAGTWSDDTSMALCALKSLANGNIDYDDIMYNFGKWYYNAEFTATGVMFDVGITCCKAINRYFNDNYPIDNCGLSDERSNGNGSLMRIHPFVLYAYYNHMDEKELVNMVTKTSALTHSHQCSIDGCMIYAYILLELLNNPSKESIYTGISKAENKVVFKNTYYNRLLNNDIALVDKADIKSGGFIVHSLEAAIWCVLTTDNYADCVLKAVNLGDDTDTVAAIAGGLAGALYGIDAIPQKWKNTLKRVTYIEDMCDDAYKVWCCNE